MRGSLFMQFLSVTISWRHISQGSSNAFKVWWDL